MPYTLILLVLALAFAVAQIIRTRAEDLIAWALAFFFGYLILTNGMVG